MRAMRVASVLLALAPVAGCASLLDFDEVEFEDESPDGGGGSFASGGSWSGNSGSGGDSGSAGSAGGGAGGSSAAGGSGAQGGAAGAGAAGGAGGAGAAGGAGGAGGGTGGSSAGGTGGGAGNGSGGGGPVDPCAGTSCGQNQYCDPADQQCYCLPGYTENGGACDPNLPGDPAAHTQAQVCDMWNWGHMLTDNNPWTAGPMECDPGTLSRAGINDAVRRTNMFRWLVGLGPTWDADNLNERNRWCAVVASWNPPGTVPNSHNPPPSAKCYTAEGAQGTGSSNLSWGRGVADAIDQFIEDRGASNALTMGHRRWLLNPPLGPIGIGYYAGGGQYGRAQCTAVFGSGGSGPSPDWVAFPPPGFSPRSIVGWTWTFQAKTSVANAEITVTRMSDGMPMPFTKQPLQGGFGSMSATSFIPEFTPASGETYSVQITGVGSGTISYEVKPVDC